MSDVQAQIDELYRFRMAYHALIVREWAKQGLYDVHKSYLHYDGEHCFGDPDWFIVVAMLPTGQISNHYHADYWNLFQCPEEPKAKYPWDGHTSTNVCERIESYLLLHEHVVTHIRSIIDDIEKRGYAATVPSYVFFADISIGTKQAHISLEYLRRDPHTMESATAYGLLHVTPQTEQDDEVMAVLPIEVTFLYNQMQFGNLQKTYMYQVWAEKTLETLREHYKEDITIHKMSVETT